jgi:hypothetical protein
MENPIVKLFNELSDADVQTALNDFIEAEKTGIYPMDSIIRTLAKQCAEITKVDTSSNLLMVQMNVLKEGALRWVKLKEKKKK